MLLVLVDFLRRTLPQTEQILMDNYAGTQSDQQQHIVSHLQLGQSESRFLVSRYISSHTCQQSMMCVYPWSRSGIQIVKGNMQNSDYAQSACTTSCLMCVDCAITTWSSMLAGGIHNSSNSTSCFVTAGAWLCSCFRKNYLASAPTADVTSLMT